MDDRQGRVGTVTALARPGEAPAGAVPPPPPLPQVEVPPLSAKPPRTLAVDEANRLRRARCDVEIEEGEEQAAEFARLDEATSLALIPMRCWSGAYNIGSLVLVAKGEGPWTAPAFDLPLDEEGDMSEADIVYNAMWNAETGLLETGMKGRGLGDCGVLQDYAWDGTGFRLVRQTEMDECRGSTDYITTWRAEVVRR
jgi:hypothetical protein